MKNTNTTYILNCLKGAALVAALAALTACVFDEQVNFPRGKAYTPITANAPELRQVDQGGEGGLEDIRLRAGDQIEIRISGVPPEDAGQINGPYTIDANGFLYLPHIGKVRASGMTPSDLQQSIQNAYRVGGFFSSPIITVNTPMHARFVYIQGQVRGQQRMAFSSDLTMLGAISTAGGFTDYANQSRVRLLRGAHVYVVNVRAIRTNPGKDIYLKPGDKIDVPASTF